MTPRLSTAFAALALALAVAACTRIATNRCGGSAKCSPFVPAADTAIADAPDGAPDVTDTEPDTAYLPDPICTAGTFWEPGTPAFRDVTAEWGLEGVQGTTIALGDIDGDGWVDAFVRGPTPRANDRADEGVRHNWLLKNTGSGFVDVTVDSGVDDPRIRLDTLARPVGVVAFGDVDNDGDLDVYTGADTFDPAVTRGETSEVMLNSGDGFFAFTRSDNGARRAGADDSPGGASFVDADRDGNLDLWVPQREYTDPDDGLTFPQDRFYRGAGDGMFADATEAVGLATLPWDTAAEVNAGRAHSRAWSAAACDMNGDGATELLASSYGRAPNHLWQGAVDDAGAVRFTNRGVASGYAYDNDLRWEDNQFARCFCESEPDAEGCADVPRPAVVCQPNWRHDTDREPYRLGGNTGATVCADLDNDGWLDLLTTEIKHWWAGEGADETSVLLNTGAADVTLDRATDRSAYGVEVPHVTSPSWDEGHLSATVLDFDNDGWPDFYVGGSEYPGNHGLLYHQRGPRTWELVPVEDGVDHNRSHGVAAADFDRDGDLDLLVGHSHSRCAPEEPNDCYPTRQVRLFENVLGDRGNWIQVQLEGGPGTNRAAIGARVRVTAGGVTQTQEVGGGYGHSGSQNDTVLHFGLGAACDARVEVRWPDASLTTESFPLVAGYRYRVVQGSAPRVAD